MAEKQSAYGEHAIPISMAMKKIEELRGTLSTRGALIASLTAALALAEGALKECGELIELERAVKGCSGPGDHKDHHADAEWSGSSQALDSINNTHAAIAKLKGTGEKG